MLPFPRISDWSTHFNIVLDTSPKKADYTSHLNVLGLSLLPLKYDLVIGTIININ